MPLEFVSHAPPSVWRFKHAAFPVENREAFGVVQKASSIKEHMQRFKAEPLAQRLSDFHLRVCAGASRAPLLARLRASR